MKNMTKIISMSLVMLLSGCATTWHNNNFHTAEAEATQFKIDNGYCKSVSYGAAPPPAVRIYSPNQSSYDVTGTVNTYNPATGYSTSQYTGTATPRSGGFASGFAQGVNNGAALGAMIAADNARDEIYEGCMTRLGWSNKPTESTRIKTNQKTQNQTPVPERWKAIQRQNDSPVYIDTKSINTFKEYPEARMFWRLGNTGKPLEWKGSPNPVRSVQILGLIDCSKNTLTDYKVMYTSEEFGGGVVVASDDMDKKKRPITPHSPLETIKQFVCAA